MKKLVFILLFAAAFLYCGTLYTLVNSKAESRINVEFGIPEDGDSSDDHIIIRKEYVLSYNKSLNSTNWVSWNLNKEWYGSVPRFDGKFITDTSLPKGMYRVSHDDYTNSGFDRGHLVRSEERTATDEQNKSTFILTNIIPQTPDLNRGAWLKLETWCEDMCKTQNKELYVIAGGIYHKGGRKIGKNVAVPDTCYKIILVLDRQQRLKDAGKKAKLIAVAMPNINGIRKDAWQKYITTVDKLESSTKYNFLDRLPDSIENELESKAFVFVSNKEKSKDKTKLRP